MGMAASCLQVIGNKLSSAAAARARAGLLRSRVLWCSVSFGLFGWALIVVSDACCIDSAQQQQQPQPQLSRSLRSSIVCALFGYSLAKFADIQDRRRRRPHPSESESESESESNKPPDPTPPPSPSSIVTPTAYCIICMESKHVADMFPINLCAHAFCSACVACYVSAKVEDNSVSIRCPDPDCRDGLLDPEACRFVVPPPVIERWERAVIESVIGPKFYCPFRDCSAVLVDDRGGDPSAIRESECPHCHRLFCASCRVAWHAGVSCKEYQKLGVGDREKEDLMLIKLARAQKWQRCPSCTHFVERTQGCMFIKCRCGFTFCYGCASEMKKDHYCAKCKR